MTKQITVILDIDGDKCGKNCRYLDDECREDCTLFWNDGCWTRLKDGKRCGQCLALDNN